MSLVPDPISLALSRRTLYGYGEIHRALGVLAEASCSPEDACRLIEQGGPGLAYAYVRTSNA